MQFHTCDPAYGTRLQIAGRFRQLREREALASIVAGALPPDQAARVTGEPEYTNELVELVFRLIRSAPRAAHSPQVLDAYMRWVLAGKGDADLSQLTQWYNGRTRQV
jgi:hypothetical protein